MTSYYKQFKYLTEFLNKEGIPLNSAEAYMLLIDAELTSCKVALEYAENYIQQTDPNDPRIAIADAAWRALDYINDIFMAYENEEPISKEPRYFDGEDMNNLPEMILGDVNYCANRNPAQEEFEARDPSSWCEGYEWIPEYIDERKGIS